MKINLTMKRYNSFLKIVLLLMAVIWLTPANAQISEGGTPPSFSDKSISKQSLTTKQIPVDFDIAALKAEDAKLEAMGYPLRIAQIIPVHMTMENSGEWTTLPSGQRIWRLSVKAPNALGILLTYDEFVIPAGGKLFIYNPSHSKVLGAYTSKNNPKRAEYATELIGGDEVILEYAEPLSDGLKDTPIAGSTQIRKQQITVDGSTADKPRIVISGIGYGYNHMELRGSDFKINWPSGACEVNVNCPEGDNWQDQKKGVARILTRTEQGFALCSGTLINNTAQNLDPLFLSAHHCYMDLPERYHNQTIYYFHYEAPGCKSASGYDPDAPTIVGATMLVDVPLNGGADGALLRLNEPIPESYNVYFNGWDRRNIAAESGVGIHHPTGDIKKISTYVVPANTTTAVMSSGEIGATNAHWQIFFAATQNGHGITEQGSSGSPLFDQNKRVVGTLTGGSSSCNNPTYQNLYGKLWYHWDQSAQKMKDYLDPRGTGLEYIDGTYSAGIDPVAVFMVSKSEIYASESVTFKDVSTAATTWDWLFAGGSPSSFSGKIPPVIAYNTPGTYEAKLVINKGTEKESSVSETITVLQKQKTCTDILNIGTGTGESPFPFGATDLHTLSSSIYTPGELGSTPGSITEIAWNAGLATAYARTLYVYIKEVDNATFAAEGNTWLNEIAGATLVYQSSAYWINDAGWTTIKLTMPFNYSGTKNLKIMVRATGTVISTSSKCYYTTTTNAHMQWVGNGQALPMVSGTVNDNRPNVKIKFEKSCGAADAPVAEFTALTERNLLKEGFDVRKAFPPAGWVIEKPGTSNSQWVQNNVQNYFFSTIDPTSVFSALVVAESGSNMVDTWLKSPAVSITDATTKMEFYTEYSGTLLANMTIMLYISSDDGVTWDQVWTAGNANTTMGYQWRKQTIDLSSYNGKTLKFAWQVKGNGGFHIGIDGVRVFTPNPSGKIEINEGETVSFTDLSSGPPVSWSWTLPGSNNETTTEVNPTAKYMNNGVYSATLKVANNFGENTKTFDGVVTVKAQKPIPTFLSYSNGFTMKSNYGQFLPLTGGRVIYQDTTRNYPKSFEWELPGADPATSTSRLFEVRYPEGKNTYPVTFKATNTAGTSELTIPDYIKVGGTAEVWNVQQGEDPTQYYSDGSEYIIAPGTGYFAFISERFVAPATGEISSVKVHTLVTSGTPVMLVGIYSDKNGMPGTLLASSTVTNLNNSGYTTVTFPQPAGVSGAFHVVLAKSSTSGAYAVSTTEARSNGYGTVYVYYQNTWMAIPALLSGFYLSMNIVPEFTYTTAELTSATSFKRKDVDATTGEVTFTASGKSWRVETDPWIIPSAQNGTVDAEGKGTFTFTCTNNTTDAVRNGAITVYASGNPLTVLVKQGGSYPSNFQAVYDDNEKDINVSWSKGINPTKSAAESSNTNMPDAEQKQMDEKSIQNVVLTPYQKLSADKYKLISTSTTSATPARASAAEISKQDDAATTLLRWDNGTNYTAIGVTASTPAEMEIAVLFDMSDLLSYQGAKIKGIEFFPKVLGQSMKVNIRQNGQIVYTQPMEGLTAGQFNRIIFTNPLTLDVTKELMVSYSYIQAAGGASDNVFVAGCDAGPAMEGKGDLIALRGDDFTPLSSISQISVNWNLAVVLETEAVKPTTYKLYRGGRVLIESMTEHSFKDKTAFTGDHCYTISATYNGDAEMESELSPATCLFAKAVMTVTAHNAERTENTPNPTFTGGISGMYLDGDTESDIAAMVSYTTDVDETSVAGMYAIRPVVNNTSPDRYAFTIVDGTLTVKAEPNTISQQPVSASVCSGENHSFNIAASGLEVTYQWQKQNGTSWQNISGANTQNLTINNATLADAGNYRVVISGRSERTYSDVATLRVGIPMNSSTNKIMVFEWDDIPMINCNPATNGGFTFVSFQWYKNGVAILGATKPFIQAEANATYHCEMLTSDNKPVSVCPFSHTAGSTALTVYPNPVESSTKFIVKMNGASEGSVINIYNVNGILVKGNIPVYGAENSVDASGLQQGVYVLQLVGPNGVNYSTKLVVK